MTDELDDLAELNVAAVAARHQTTIRARELVEAGTPLSEVCAVLHLDRQGWYEALDALASWRNQ